MSALPQPPAAGAGEPARIFLDAASAQPLHPVASRALAAALADGWADPARLYREGRRARALLDAARESIAGQLGARRDEISFCPSGTQAAQLGVLGLAAGRRRVSDRVVVSAVEHSAVLRSADMLAAAAPLAARRGSDTSSDPVVTVPVDEFGRVDPAAFAAAATGPGPAALACLQSANGEIGTVQPVAEVADRLAGSGVPLLVDAAASLGWLPPPAGWSVLTGTATAWGGPAGVGVLAVRTGVRWRSPLPDDEREGGRVPGLPAVPLIVAAAAALEVVGRDRLERAARAAALVDRVRAAVVREVPDVQVHGHPTQRAPHIVGLSVLYAAADALVAALDRAGIAVASGSACVADTRRPSHVLVAIGAVTHGNLRLSLPLDCAEADVERFLAVLPAAVAEVRDAG